MYSRRKEKTMAGQEVLRNEKSFLPISDLLIKTLLNKF